MEFFQDTWYLFLRLARATLRMPVFLVISIVQPILWVLLFGQLFKRVVAIPGFEASSYVQFLAPGISIMTALFGAAPASLDFLIPTKVEGEVRKLVYPPGEVFHSAFAAEPLRVYSGTVAIRAEAATQAGAVRLTYQACDDCRCLPPVTRELAVPPRSD
jgi:cytochrome c biogenesis DsbD-like protein